MIKEFENADQRFRELESIEAMTRTSGWQLFMKYIKNEQTRYLKEARDKRRQFNGNNIAVFMACEGTCDSIANWAQNQLSLLERAREEAKLNRDSK